MHGIRVIQTGHFEQVIFKGKDVSTQMSIIAKYRAVKKTAFPAGPSFSTTHDDDTFPSATGVAQHVTFIKYF